MTRIKRVLLAVALALPISLLLGYEANLLTGGGEAGGYAYAVVWLAAWPLLAFYLSRPTHLRTVWGRSCIAFALVAFALPIATIIFAIIHSYQLIGAEETETGQAMMGFAAIIAGGAMVVMAFVLSLFTGIIALLLGRLALRPA